VNNLRNAILWGLLFIACKNEDDAARKEAEQLRAEMKVLRAERAMEEAERTRADTARENERLKAELAAAQARTTSVPSSPAWPRQTFEQPADRPSPKPRMFYCDKVPGIAGMRVCHRKAEYCTSADGGCSEQTRAQCYFRSMADYEHNRWSETQKDASCFPTREECEKDRAGVGAWGPPPIQTDCFDVGISELPPL
jgi:hypothetical protein